VVQGPGALLNFLATLGHSMPDGREKFTLDELIAEFDLDRISVAGPVFDLAKLKHLQGQYFRELSPERMKQEVHNAIDSRIDGLLPLFRERMAFGGDFIWQAEPFYADKVDPHADDLVPKGLDKAQAKALLEQVQQALKHYVAGEAAVWDAPALDAFLRKLVEEKAAVAPDAPDEVKIAAAKMWQPKILFMLLRVATTGKKESPPLFDTLAQIGHIKVIERLGLAQQKLR
jgi:glutamyl-tRNA synthetase